MKKILILSIAVLLLISSVTIMAYAHSGGTDANGGHYDKSTGEYHYHHGYPAHKHTGGRCPYDYEDNTDSGNGYSSSYSSSYTSSSSSDEDIFIWWVFLLTLALNIIALLPTQTRLFESKIIPEWLLSILGIVMILIPIAILAFFVYNFLATLVSCVIVYGGWFGLKKYLHYRRQKKQREADNDEEDE